jgi:hypothetical protein
VVHQLAHGLKGVFRDLGRGGISAGERVAQVAGVGSKRRAAGADRREHVVDGVGSRRFQARAATVADLRSDRLR